MRNRKRQFRRHGTVEKVARGRRVPTQPRACLCQGCRGERIGARSWTDEEAGPRAVTLRGRLWKTPKRSARQPGWRLAKALVSRCLCFIRAASPRKGADANDARAAWLRSGCTLHARQYLARMSGTLALREKGHAWSRALAQARRKAQATRSASAEVHQRR